MDVASGRRRVYTNFFKLQMVRKSSIHAWLKKEPGLEAACKQRKGSRLSMGGQGRPVTFPHEDDVRQFIKDMRREDVALKTSHVVQFIKEEYECTKVRGAKISARVTVLLIIAADGSKLPPLIIYKAKPGGSIEDAFGGYPAGATYAVQRNAWMDNDVWQASVIGDLWTRYCSEKFREPLALYVDNFKTHVDRQERMGKV
ncbi:hypothetical protein ATCC90586_005557 [Pythium insidiosum]|nr:hypothetical protein ATCC90586_005557 [Pythium insidiosum]